MARWCIAAAGLSGAAAFTCIPLTPMRSTSCERIPSVEQCVGKSWVITDDCLRKCVQAQCKGATVACDDFYTEAKCAPKKNGDRVAGFVIKGSQSCTSPRNDGA